VVEVTDPPLEIVTVPPLKTLDVTTPGMTPLLVAVRVSPELRVRPELVTPEMM
jgi:hypothetical protein